MRTLPIVLFLSCVLRLSLFAATIAHWDFNSVPEDPDATTGTILVSGGAGNLTFFGGATNSFGSVGGGSPSDLNEADDSQMRITRLAAQGTRNKGVGIELQVSTRAFESLRISWDQYNSATASRYWRVMISTDAVSWIHAAVIIQTNASKWVRHSVSFRDQPAVNDADLVLLRIAPEFESSATGAGLDEYRAINEGSNYSTAGSWWIDYLTISGREIGTSNALPTISAINDQAVVQGSKSALEFIVSDAETTAENLIIGATVSTSNIITNLTIKGTGMTRTLEFHAASPGQTEIAIKVEDGEGGFAETSFTVTVLPKDSEPSFSPAFVVWDFNSPSPDLDASTGSLEPAAGAGALLVLGVSSSSFGSVGQGRSSDPAEQDNSMLRLTGFPRDVSQPAGLEIRASTVGLRTIGLVWDQYNSATASRYLAVQYTRNGTDFVNHVIVSNTTASTWLRERFVSFSSVTEAENNPLFGVRIVSAPGADGAYEAVTTGSTFGPTGTLWLDMLKLTGELGTAVRPSISCEVHDGGIRMHWPKTSEVYLLEMSEDFEAGWQAVDATIEEVGEILQLKLSMEGERRFYRLRKRDTE